MIRTYLNQGTGGPSYSKLQVTGDHTFSALTKPGQLTFRVFGDSDGASRSVVLDAEQIEDLRQYLNARTPPKQEPKVVVEP